MASEKSERGVKNGRTKSYEGKLTRQERVDLTNSIVARKNKKNRRQVAALMQLNMSCVEKLARLDAKWGGGAGRGSESYIL